MPKTDTNALDKVKHLGLFIKVLGRTEDLQKESSGEE